MVIGLPGSGKSFFARQFAETFGAPLVSIDLIRHIMKPNSTFTPEEDAQIMTLADQQIHELLKTNKTIIIDGGMNHRSQRLAIERLAQKHGYGKLTIWVQTDEPTSLARSVKRSSKRATDELNSPMSPETFARYKKQFIAPTRTENTVVISGKHTFATQARVVLKKLVAPRDVVVTSRSSEMVGNSVKPEQQSDVQPRRRNVTIN